MVEILGLVIAAIAVTAAIIDHRRQRRHDRLSVTPAVGLNCAYDCEEGTAYLELINTGLGPARIHSVSVRSRDGEIRHSLEAKDEILAMLPTLPRGVSINAYLVYKGACLAANEEVLLLECDATATSAQASNTADAYKALCTLVVEVEGESFYGDHFRKSMDPLTTS